MNCLESRWGNLAHCICIKRLLRRRQKEATLRWEIQATSNFLPVTHTCAKNICLNNSPTDGGVQTISCVSAKQDNPSIPVSWRQRVCVLDCKYQIKVVLLGGSLHRFFLPFVVSTGVNTCSLSPSHLPHKPNVKHTHKFKLH